MYLQKTILSGVCLLVFMPGMVIGDHFTDYQARLLDAELGRIQIELELEENWVAQITSELQPELIEAGKRMKAAHPGGMCSPAMDRQLLKATWGAVANKLTDTKALSFESYQKQCSQQLAESDQIGINALVLFFDEILCFDEKQFDRLTQKFSEHWHPDYNAAASRLGWDGITPESREYLFFKEVAGESLNEQQSRLLGDIHEFPIGLSKAINLEYVDGEQVAFDAEKYKKHCQRLLDQKLDEFSRQLKLTSKQQSKLRVAKNGAVGQMVKDQQKLLGSFDPANGLGKKILRIATRPLLHRCTEQPLWELSVQKTLDQTQLEMLEQWQGRKKEIATDYFACQLVQNLLVHRSKVPLGFKDQQQLTELIAAKLEVTHVGDFWENPGLLQLTRQDLDHFLNSDDSAAIWEGVQSLQSILQEEMSE